MEASFWAWVGFIGFVLAMLALDLGVLNRKDHVVRPREALRWSALWIALALAFGALLWARYGSEPALQYLAGYVIEKSLSVDNIFLFAVVFGALGIPAMVQHRVLFWGIVTALVLRGVMIAGGAALLHRFHWVIYVFGAFLLLTGVKLLVFRGNATDPERSVAFRLLRRLVPATPRFDGKRFFTVENGKRLATPLFFALALIEVSDVIFAVDSIPAILAITDDPFIVYTSNIFAILGLRAMYFLLSGFVDRFRYLKPSLALVLIFVGMKMALADLVKVHAAASLAVILAILGTGVVASVLKARRVQARERASGARASVEVA